MISTLAMAQKSNAVVEIEKVLAKQKEAWNKGDIDESVTRVRAEVLPCSAVSYASRFRSEALCCRAHHHKSTTEENLTQQNRTGLRVGGQESSVRLSRSDNVAQHTMQEMVSTIKG